MATPSDSKATPVPRRGALTSAAIALVCGLAPALVLTCGPSEPGSTGGTQGTASPTGAGGAKTVSAAGRRDRIEQGRKLYLANCSGCHGEKGRGDGPSSLVVDVPPRDLTRDKFRYRTTASGQPPRRSDIMETINRGMPGSSMPAFAFLPLEERELLVDYVRHLAGISDVPEPESVALGAETPVAPTSIEHGKKVYMEMQCHKCHGDTGKGDGPSAPTLKDERERPIAVRDVAKGYFRRGKDASEVARTFMAGLDGTPMPSYSNSLKNDEAWDLARYILSLKKAPEPVPADPIAHAKRIIEEKQCNACHVIEGKGGVVGPSLDVSSKKLKLDWVKEWLKNPRKFGKIYPFMPYRMPDLGLSDKEVESLMTYIASLAGRKYPEAPEPAPVIAEEKAKEGLLFYVVKCAECHNLGNVIPTPLAKQQGPDLVNVTQRVRFEWIPEWVKNPQNVYPGTTMVDTNLTDHEIDIVRAFLWKTATSASDKSGN